ncbi:MAG TPA: flagellar hook-basal body complex protein [Pseudolabrys sp.]|nr:flagellar hook-basal body complex protein [Pseudolabrys sp.]
MGLFGAMNTAVNGLQSQSYALQNISGNIANSQTVAYKSIGTSFVDLIPDSPPGRQIAGGVIANSVSTNDVQGAIQNASVSTYMAINGSGYFAVKQPSSTNGSGPLFNTSDLYTRRGDFQMDQFGYLVNGAGYYLEGIPIDPKTGNPVGNAVAPLQFNNTFLPATATTTITYGANLPTYPKTTLANTAFPGSELLDPSGFLVNPTTSGTGTVIGSDVTTFLNSSLDGGSITAYNTSGQAVNTQLRWAKTDSSNLPAQNAKLIGSSPLGVVDASGGNITFDINGTTVTLSSVFAGSGGAGKYSVTELENAINNTVGITATASTDAAGHLMLTSTGTAGAADTVTLNNFTGASSPDATLLGYPAGPSASASGKNANSGSDTWNLFYQSDSTATGAQVAWTNVGMNFTFDSTGNLSPSISSIPLSGVTIDGTSLGNIAIKINGLTQFSTSSGSATVTSLNQDGYPPGQLQSISISKEGRIAGSFTNGKNVDLAQIPLYSFASPNNLKSLDGGAFAITGDSGPALMGASGQLVGAALEGSNADIADQFTKLIVTQQAYSANTRVITTANQMSQDMLNMLR